MLFLGQDTSTKPIIPSFCADGKIGAAPNPYFSRRTCLAYVYVEKSGGLDEHSARGILRRRRHKRNSAQGGAERNPGSVHENTQLLKELRNLAKRDFGSKTLGTPRLIPAFNDDGQMAWTRARYPLPLFQSGPHTNIQDPGFRFAPPWAEVYYAFGVFPRCYLLKMP
jgi:hypothetical protein